MAHSSISFSNSRIKSRSSRAIRSSRLNRRRPAPYFRRFAKNRQIKAFVDGVTAAATGAIAGAAVVLGRRSIVDVPTVLICLATLAILFGLKKVPEPLVILVAGAVGLVLNR
ncbi:MAG: chromate transporter [Gemmataceae bacterium]|nr:chromate transporter [Gemmataceae bacterium]